MISSSGATIRRSVKLDARGSRRVADVMTTDVISVYEATPFKEIVGMLHRNRISAVPVVDANFRVLGVVSESDLLAHVFGGTIVRPRSWLRRYHGSHRHGTPAATARDLMSSPAVVTKSQVTVGAAARAAAKARVRRLPVVDSDGALVGIVTRSDLLRPFLRTDAKIRDEITKSIQPVFIDAGGFAVKVRNGVVVLTGSVDTKPLKVMLTDSIRHVSGVIDVDDRQLDYHVNDTRPTFPDNLSTRPYWG